MHNRTPDGGMMMPTPDGGMMTGDGAVPTGVPRWSARLGGMSDDIGVAAAGTVSGDVVVTGLFQDTADLGGVSFASAGAIDFFVGKYSKDGKAMWVRHYGGSAQDVAYSVAIAAPN